VGGASVPEGRVSLNIKQQGKGQNALPTLL